MAERIVFNSEEEGAADKDEMGRLRLSEVPLGDTLRRISKKTLDACGLKVTIVEKGIGYELRGADPIPFDRDYTRNLGYGAVRFLKTGGTGCTIISDAQDIQSIPFSEFIDASGQSKVRKVDINSQIYQVARKYMIRLEPEDFEGKQLRRLASCTCLGPEEFQRRFAPAII